MVGISKLIIIKNITDNNNITSKKAFKYEYSDSVKFVGYTQPYFVLPFGATAGLTFPRCLTVCKN